ncbi:MAG: transporter substrate-binding domain-containing protein [Sebaldella sp.]|nr:transporter substrate-binding domain-containing protein [Sebaldella sp.]
MLSKNNFKLEKMSSIVLLLMIVLLGRFSYNAEVKGKEIAKKKYYIIGVPVDNVPFEMEKNKKISGIDIELLEEISKIEGFRVIWKPMTDTQLTENLKTKKLDGVMNGIVEGQDIDISDPYFVSGSVGVARIDNIYVNSMENFKGKMFGVVKETEEEEYANSISKSYEALVIPYENNSSLSKDLAEGNIDIAFIDHSLAYYINNQSNTIKLKILTDKVNSENIVFIVKKGENLDLIKMFNEGLQKIKENGKYNEIIKKYIGDDTLGFVY